MSRRRTDVPPTKSNLLRLREHYRFVVAGHELLEQKREILLEELLEIRRDAEQLRGDVERALATLYRALADALVSGGRPPLESEALADMGAVSLKVRERSVMGVIVPLLELEASPATRPATAPAWAAPAPARIGRLVREAIPTLGRLAEVEITSRRLGAELAKTERKVNALEKVFVPEYRDTLRFIESTLEERERESHFQMKLLKVRRATREEEL